MPELPDVEIYRRYVDSTALHQKIENVDVNEEQMVGEVSPRSLQMQLKGSAFKSTLRHGKYLFVKTDREKWLVLHFGMTGFLKYFKNREEAPDHIRLQINFSNKFHLAYGCKRKFGLIDMVEKAKNFIRDRQLGIDPYREELDFQTLKDLLKNRRGTIKSFLMNQKIIAGIGNIYSDEILFQAKIHPNSAASKLNGDDIKSILKSMQQVFRTAIDNNANTDQMPGRYLIHVRDSDATCPICQKQINNATIAGRSCYYCPNHQQLIQ